MIETATSAAPVADAPRPERGYPIVAVFGAVGLYLREVGFSGANVMLALKGEGSDEEYWDHCLAHPTVTYEERQVLREYCRDVTPVGFWDGDADAPVDAHGLVDFEKLERRIARRARWIAVVKGHGHGQNLRVLASCARIVAAAPQRLHHHFTPELQGVYRISRAPRAQTRREAHGSPAKSNAPPSGGSDDDPPGDHDLEALRRGVERIAAVVLEAVALLGWRVLL